MNAQQAPEAGIDRPSLLFILAVFGLHLAFMPLLVLLLPRRAEVIFGSSVSASLSATLLIGAITASIANIAAGHFSDLWFRRFANRRGLIAIGLSTLFLTFGLLANAHDLKSLIVAIIAFQMALNLTLAPVMALLADHIADSRKGLIAGWLGTAIPLSALGTAGLGWAFPIDDNAAFYAIAMMSVLCVLPMIVFWGFGPAEHAQPLHDHPETGNPVRALALLWLARVLVQIAASFVLLYLFVLVSGLVRSDAAWQAQSATGYVSVLSLLGAAIAVPSAIASGRLSDHVLSRQTIMAGAALVLAIALFLFWNRPSPWTFGFGFILFQMGLATYLSIDAALVAQLIARLRRRGAILGVMNLTNTLPAILAPLLALYWPSEAEHAPQLGQIYPYCAMSLLISAFVVLASRKACLRGRDFQ